MKKILLFFALISCAQFFAQNNNSNLKIYLNCNRCDETYIKQNLNYVDFVRDQNFADTHILFRTQQNGSGGTSYEIEFTGQNNYSDINEKITFSTNADNTSTEVRDMVFKNLKLGLIRYWIKNGMQDNISIKLKKEEVSSLKEAKDPWNKWVFNLGVNGYFYGQETSKDQSLSFNTTIKRVTEKNKFYLRGNLNNNKSTFTYDGEDIISNQKSTSIYAYDVISINNHWSVGAFASVGKSTFSNKAFYASFKPAVEYNFFSYEESSKKQLTLSYRIGGIHNNYEEKTIFNKEEELIWEHSLNLGGSVKQKWGNISSEVSYESYLHDSNLRAFSFYLGANFRIIKGLSFRVSGNYGITDNQINLVAGDLSLEELLLRQQQVKSGYNYFVSTGLNYSFGSIYNSIVNPRFNF